MRRICLAVAAVSVVLSAVAMVPVAPASAVGDDTRGLVYQGLDRDPAVCRGAFRIRAGNENLCSHGPDAAPPGIDVRRQRPPDPPWMRVGLRRPGLAGQPTTAADVAGTQCYGDGSSGPRVQLIYARASNRTDRYAQF